MSLPKIKLPASTKKLLGFVLAFGVGFVVSLAPLTGAKRIPYFQPLADVLLERHKSLLLPVSGILLAAIATLIHFYSGEKLSLKPLRRCLFATLAVFLASLGAFLVLPRYVIKVGCAVDPVVVGFSRLPSCQCGQALDADCLAGNGCGITGCWSQGQVNAVELSMYVSYLGSLCGFVALVGIVVLIEQARSQARRRSRRPRQEPESLAGPEAAG